MLSYETFNLFYMRKTYLLFIVLIIVNFAIKNHAQENKYTISGYVTEEGSKELIIGANIYINN